MGISLEYHRYIGISWEYNGNIMGISLEIMGISLEYRGDIMGISWEYHGNIIEYHGPIMGVQQNSWEYHGNIMNLWEYHGIIRWLARIPIHRGLNGKIVCKSWIWCIFIGTVLLTLKEGLCEIMPKYVTLKWDIGYSNMCLIIIYV